MKGYGEIRLMLLEIGKEFQIKIRGYTNKPQYKCTKILKLKNPKIRIPLKKLKEKFEKLQQSYPNKHYYLTPIMYRGRKYWKFGRVEPNQKGIPLYYSTTLGKIYVPSTYVEKKYKLVCSVLLYRLRDLGVPYSLRYA